MQAYPQSWEQRIGDVARTVVWVLLAGFLLYVLATQHGPRGYDSQRTEVLNRFEKERGSRVISLIHRQESTSVLGVRSEVLFAPVYVGAPMFGDLNKFMLDEGLELLNFDYSGAGNKSGRFTLPGRHGKLLSSDAVWIVGNDRLFAAKAERLAEDVIRLALFLVNNGATDVAVDLLIRAVTREGVSLALYDGQPIFQALHKKALLLFKSLLAVPQLQEAEVTGAYRTIFDREFPLMNQFYQSELFN